MFNDYSFLESAQMSYDNELSRRVRNGEDLRCAELLSEKCDERVRELGKLLAEQSSNSLSTWRADESAFTERCRSRWRQAFDLLESLIMTVAAVGEENERLLRPKAAEENDWKFDAIAHLHAKAVLISKEIYQLLKGGFPDGALSRWRTLHELSVTASFIHQNETNIAHRYVASFWFRALRAAHQLNEYAERARLEPFGDADIERLESTCKSLEAQFGRSLEGDYAWAKPALGKKVANFASIEESVGMDHWRPRFKWASQHIHAGHRPADRVLGMSEAKEYAHLVGPSNSGFSEPIHMCAISLMQVFSSFLLLEPNVDRIAWVNAVQGIVDDLGVIVMRMEERAIGQEDIAE